MSSDMHSALRAEPASPVRLILRGTAIILAGSATGLALVMHSPFGEFTPLATFAVTFTTTLIGCNKVLEGMFAARK